MLESPVHSDFIIDHGGRSPTLSSTMEAGNRLASSTMPEVDCFFSPRWVQAPLNKRRQSSLTFWALGQGSNLSHGLATRPKSQVLSHEPRQWPEGGPKTKNATVEIPRPT